MAIKSNIDKEKDLTTYVLSGETSTDHLLKALKSFFNGNITANVLWDLREAEFGEGIPSANLKELAVYSKKKQPEKARGKIAIVASSDLGFGMSRIFEVYAELEGVKNPVQVYRSMKKAMKWLEEE
jgi:hypothetical protein